MVAPGVDKQMLRELESMGFPLGSATRALHYSGNSSIIDAINWILDHEGDCNVDQMPQAPIDIKIESGKPSQEEVKMKLKVIREQAKERKEEYQRQKEREEERERIRMAKQLMEVKHAEDNERKRIISFHELEKEERRARENWRQLAQDKEERRGYLELSPQNPGAVKPVKLPMLGGNVLKNTRSVSPAMEETMKDCLRSLRKNHKDDDAEVKKAFQTLTLLVGNVARHPENEKYRKIRLSNPNFQDRVGKFKEGIEFLELCGFKRLEGNGFLYMPRNKVETTVLNSAGWALNSAITNPFFGLLSV